MKSLYHDTELRKTIENRLLAGQAPTAIAKTFRRSVYLVKRIRSRLDLNKQLDLFPR